jgi:hypothetical protein
MAFWSNLVTYKWDQFAKENNASPSKEFRIHLKLPLFREKSNEEYHLFRNFFQMVDIITLDYESLQYSEKLICASLVYCLIGLFLKHFDIAGILNNFLYDPSTFASFYDFNMIFNRFLNKQLLCGFDDIIEHVMWVSWFFNMKFQYSSPLIRQDEDPENKFVPYEDFLQTQTYNSNNMKSLEYICSLKKGEINN